MILLRKNLIILENNEKVLHIMNNTSKIMRHKKLFIDKN